MQHYRFTLCKKNLGSSFLEPKMGQSIDQVAALVSMLLHKIQVGCRDYAALPFYAV